jgi:hypothetical protein
MESKNKMYQDLLNKLHEKIQKHHELYRFPVKAELWEDIFDQCINHNLSDWIGGGHSAGADVVSKSDKLFEMNSRFQLKSGDINFNKGTLRWNGHRTTKHKTLTAKLDFISSNHSDYYVMLARDKNDWKIGKQIYYLVIFNSNKIDYTLLKWSEKYGKNKNLTGWVGVGHSNFTAEISKSMSDQLWTIANLSYLGDYYKIEIK